MGNTIQITTSNNVTRTCGNTIYNTANAALTSGIIYFVKHLAQIINDIFLSNLLLVCCIRNPTQAIIIPSGALYNANLNLVKTKFLDMGITIEITTSNIVTRTCANTIYNTANGALTSGIIAFVQLFAQIINDIFVSNFLLFCCIRNPTQVITIFYLGCFVAQISNW